MGSYSSTEMQSAYSTALGDIAEILLMRSPRDGIEFIFSLKGISPKVNVIARIGFELTYYDVTVNPNDTSGL